MKEVRQQIAAMPLRWKGESVQVLMVTTRDTKRWIVPKGWTMKDVKPWAAAATEAMEEAGVSGHVAKEVFGTFTYDKRLDNGDTVPCRVRVYPMIVEDEHKRWKEKSERKRAWFDVRKAAKLVDEPELADLLRSLAKKPKKVPVVGPILRRAAS
ncbi:NUDIX hydrolase [Jannaschia seohaensis]|uniref:NUDIX domain-containing protein n=1 Tax=Jannaschia seohaensis TaxID=475081 RepID=A0A2Y9AGE7_9RHOB|nr:NUDIX hydrolase [Jannaschia seohaensis]PWJ21219.1 NUDIX domain-containing protein [Jannaschia seohaensis]SSA41629.1 NUDIX domain-containing protein [Jannaschia seohaensis]